MNKERKITKNNEFVFYQEQSWYQSLNEENCYIFELIFKYHSYFSSQDKKFRSIVQILRFVLLFLAMTSTIVLGLKTIIDINLQIVFGLIISALITFVAAILSYFNFEEYWMRNIAIHIELNTLRDNFIFEAKAKRLDSESIENYRKKLDELQHKNISYWEKAIKKI